MDVPAATNPSLANHARIGVMVRKIAPHRIHRKKLPFEE
jgi:hypothetical protein